jgi:hypothetical protein
LDSRVFTSTSRRIFFELLVVALVTISVSMPKDESYSEGWKFAVADLPTLVHILVAALALVEAGILLARCLRVRNIMWSALALIGFVGVLLAFFFGDRLIADGQNALTGMTYSWLIAWVVFAGGWIVGRRQQRVAVSVAR